MRRLGLSAAIAAIAAAGGCRVGGVEPLPLVGPAPECIAIWPLVEGAEPPDDDLWFTGLPAAVGGRGYRIVPPGVVTELLRDVDPGMLADENRIGRALRADALLLVLNRAFEADGDGAMRSARWDVEWRLVSTRGHGTQWSFRHNGTWQQPPPERFDPGRSLDRQQEPGPLVPIGGQREPGFRDARELVAWLNRMAGEHLPRR